MLSKVGEFEGTKEQLQNSYKIREHFQVSLLLECFHGRAVVMFIILF